MARVEVMTARIQDRIDQLKKNRDEYEAEVQKNFSISMSAFNARIDELETLQKPQPEAPTLEVLE